MIPCIKNLNLLEYFRIKGLLGVNDLVTLKRRLNMIRHVFIAFILFSLVLFVGFNVTADSVEVELLDTSFIGVKPVDCTVGPEGKYIYVVSHDAKISVINAETKQVEEIIITGWEQANVIDYVAENKAYVTVYNGDRWKGTKGAVLVFDLTTHEIIKKIQGFDSPDGLDISSDSKRAYVSDAVRKEIVIIDTQSNTVINRIQVPNIPIYLDVEPGERYLYLTATRSWDLFKILVVDLKKESVIDTLRLAGKKYNENSLIYSTPLVSPDGKFLYVSAIQGNKVFVWDTNTHELANTIEITSPHQMLLGYEGRYLFVARAASFGGVSIVDTKTNEVVGEARDRLYSGKTLDLEILLDKDLLYVINQSNSLSTFKLDVKE